METTDKTCRERIADHMSGRMADIDGLNKAKDEEREDLEESLQNNVLSIEKTVTYNILLSWGGPSDGFKITVTADNEFKSGKYYFADWFDYAERELTDDEAQMVCNTYGLWEVEF